jgi:TatD family-associated radical SAM protein
MQGVGGHLLWLRREPTAAEVLAAVGDPTGYAEIVFCGYGESTCAAPVMLEVAHALKPYGVPIRVDTNGLSDLINGYDIVPDLAQTMTSVSISLNAPDAESYDKLCNSQFGLDAFPAILDFARRCKAQGIRLVLSVMDNVMGRDLDRCRGIATEIGADLRVRAMINEL